MEYDQLSFEQLRRRAAELEASAEKDYSVVVLRNITVEPIETYLRYLCAGLERRAVLRFSGYDVLLGATVEASTIDLDGADAVLVFLKLEQHSPVFCYEYGVLETAERAAETARVRTYVEQVVAAIREHCDALIVWYGFETPTHTAHGVIDSHLEQGQAQAIGQLNEAVKTILRQAKDAYFVDPAPVANRIGFERYYDHRYWFMAGAPYSRDAIKGLAQQAFKLIRARLGASKKCLVLDCDNVLWGGIVGEDGVNGVRLGTGFPGSAYQVFQRRIRELTGRGVILALNSKNNERDVWEVFDTHPDMILKREHIAAWRINWQDKASNLMELADELNIGLDSMVFVDDNEAEVELVRQTLPEVESVLLPVVEPVRYVETLFDPGWFDTLRVSEEDLKRGEMYRVERQRRQLKHNAVDLDSYLRSLKMNVEIRHANEYSIPRVAQLTRKTNQFNLTTRRYTEAEIERFAAGDEFEVLTLRLSDRFGDYGLVGVAIIRTEAEVWTIDSFLMSCRALNRGAENALLSAVLELAARQRAREVRAVYAASPKNALAADFYSDNGFVVVARAADEVQYLYDLKAKMMTMPPHFDAVAVDYA